MKMSNSKLVDYTKISPNSSNPRTNKIKKLRFTTWQAI